MSPTRLVALVALWGLSLAVAWSEGMKRGTAERLTNQEAQARSLVKAQEAQVRALVDTAFPPTQRAPGVISVPPAKVAEAVEAHKSSPEVVRAILYEEVQRELWENYGSMNLRGLTPDAKRMLKDNASEYERRLVAVRDWRAGQEVKP